MNKLAALLIVTLALSLAAAAQNSNSGVATPPPATQADKQSNAASATQDNSAISGDQVTKPAGAKTSSVIGCLGGADSGGHFTLKSMQYRSGVEVLGPNNLEAAAGQKVKLTGQWVPASGSQDAATDKKNRRFQATSVEVLAEKCPSPGETTPISKKKQQQQKAAASQSKSSNNPE